MVVEHERGALTHARVRWKALLGDGSCRALRRAFRDFLTSGAAPESDVSGAELILGELLANVVRHGRGAASVDVDWSDERPVLTVVDDGPGFAGRVPEGRLPHASEERGRGLALVKTIAVDTVFADRPEGGAAVRVVLPVRRASVYETGSGSSGAPSKSPSS